MKIFNKIKNLFSRKNLTAKKETFSPIALNNETETVTVGSSVLSVEKPTVKTQLVDRYDRIAKNVTNGQVWYNQDSNTLIIIEKTKDVYNNDVYILYDAISPNGGKMNRDYFEGFKRNNNVYLGTL